ncbi:MAG: 3-hydroxyacyl-CoA dehydrogenase NAD-binding domain-containing protein [Aestuariivita sp.]|nr:3-hydroxyacyl-CoA dehydrogenase NAD-binding domain-containing protein [Aestuariivita sp.]MCY4203408.1 3-hydroxyacyl-CoA dehydrogenase NAD-binding domain-containing protein [Aestuariivita sp.]
MSERVTGAVTKTAENLGLRRAAVIGAGAMGSGIAAHLANAGIEVDLLDIIPENANDHNAKAKMGVERQLKSGGFMHPDRANSVRIGNVTDDFDRLADADWIIEAVFEDLQIKRDLYARIEGIRKSGSIISSNTSTIRLADLTEERSDSFARDFVITHFFNPPRRMKLLEIVSNNQTSSEVVARIEAINDHLLGKSNIRCFDTPGFIANRVGNFWMSVASMEAFRLGLTVEETDAVMSRPFGIPRTGIFGLFDFVGIQLVPLVWGSFMQSLPVNDRHRDFDITQSQIFATMIERGLIGRVGPGGFYRRKNAVGERVNDVLDLESMEYRPATAANFVGLTDQTDLRGLCEYDHKGAHYAFSVLSNVVSYASTIAGEIAENISDIDLAMRLGYNWKKGPFELADQVGADWIAQRLDVAGQTVPDLLRQAAENGGFYPEDSQMQRIGGGVKTRKPLAGVLTLAAIKRKSTRVAGNLSASIWDLGDDVAGFEIHTKMNACDEDVIAMAAGALKVVESNFRGLVIGSDNVRAFSAGAQLDTFVRLCEANDWGRLSAFVASGQLAFHNLKYANFPVVAAAGGLAIGGGAELSMHADHVVAHSELAAGLPERNVGIVPGWGGVTQLLLRHQQRNPDWIKGAVEAFRTLIECQISQSALQARDTGLLRETDSIVMNRDRLLAAAKIRVIELSSDYRAPIPASIFAGGDALFEQLIEIAQRKRDSEEFTATDVEICRRAAEVISGRDLPSKTDCDELAFMELERRAVLALAKQESTQARLKHMLITNTVLRN